MTYTFKKLIQNPDDSVSLVFRDAAGGARVLGLNEFAMDDLPISRQERTRAAVKIIDAGADYNFRPMTEAEARAMSYA